MHAVDVSRAFCKDGTQSNKHMEIVVGEQVENFTTTMISKRKKVS